MVIDDLADRIHDCDLLLDQNLFTEMAHRYDGKVPDKCGLMMGPAYALLQPRVPPREGPIRRILVYFGGTDTDNFTGMSIAAFLGLGMTEVVLDVVINTTSPNAQSIRQQVSGHRQISLHEDLPSLAHLMVKADLAVGAGGATSWERCCLALPSLVITLAENQKPIASELAKHELIRWLGHKNEVSQATLARALKEICSAALSPDWSNRCHQRVDGRGVDRVTNILTINAQTELKARLARLDDESLFQQWVDSTLVRQSSSSLDAVDPSLHRVWFRKHLRDQNNCRLYVVETTDGFPVGQVRFERTGDTEAWEIDYDIGSQIRDAGIVKLLLQTAMLALRASTDKALLFTHINDPSNSPRGIFEIMDFEPKIQKRQLSIAVCSDAGSWINVAVPDLLLGWLTAGHRVTWTHSASDLGGGDLCFYLSYGRIVDAATLARYRNNLVVHASDLPKGRGWSPTSWLILENASRMTSRLFILSLLVLNAIYHNIVRTSFPLFTER
jgi:spore coat polysaccharide biosynthesis predicted glycosyltransferase SpsG